MNYTCRWSKDQPWSLHESANCVPHNVCGHNCWNTGRDNFPGHSGRCWKKSNLGKQKESWTERLKELTNQFKLSFNYEKVGWKSQTLHISRQNSTTWSDPSKFEFLKELQELKGARHDINYRVTASASGVKIHRPDQVDLGWGKTLMLMTMKPPMIHRLHAVKEWGWRLRHLARRDKQAVQENSLKCGGKATNTATEAQERCWVRLKAARNLLKECS